MLTTGAAAHVIHRATLNQKTLGNKANMDSTDESIGLVDSISETPLPGYMPDVDTKAKSSWKCQICGVQIKSKKANFDRHMKRHATLVMYLKCSGCGQKCSNDYNFNVHCVRKHKNEPKPTAAIRWNYSKGMLY